MSLSRKCYLDTRHGQLHARTLGSGEPVVLLHLTPGSGKQFDHILPVVADRGYEAWAFDVLGNGRSDAQPEDYSFEIAAQAIGDAIHSAGLRSIKLVGGHMSAQMAVELLADAPTLATHLVIDGLPMWDRETRARIIAMFDNTAPPTDESGAHVLEAWRRTLQLHRAWNPDLVINESSGSRLHRAVIDALEAGLDGELAARAFLEYDVQPRMGKLQLPTLVTTATADTLHDQHAATMQAMSSALEHTFVGTHPRHVVDRADEYVDVLTKFFQTS